MISKRDKANIVNGLEDTIERYFEGESGNFALPYRGDGVNRLMAEAAFAVLEAVDNTQDYLNDEGLFIDHDDDE